MRESDCRGQGACDALQGHQQTSSTRNEGPPSAKQVVSERNELSSPAVCSALPGKSQQSALCLVRNVRLNRSHLKCKYLHP